MRLRRTYNAELFHSGLESGAVETETCGCSIRAREFPLGLFQHGQNMSAFGFFKRLGRRGDCGRGVMLEILQGNVRTLPGERITARSRRFCSLRMLPGQE